MALPLLLLASLGCQRPETALRERSAQRLELVLKVDGATPEEERAVVTQLAAGLGVPVDPPAEPTGSLRVFRLTLAGHKNPYESRGLGATWAATAATGALYGALLPGMAGGVGLAAMPIGAGLGLIGGVAYGPAHYANNQALQEKLGYLPWVFDATWEVLERNPPPLESVVASRRHAYLDLGPHLLPLPEADRSETAVRKASLQAYVEALLKLFQKKG
ncbi:MAG: hypothetical protein HGB30_05320 [Holophagaceae bacterium]|nr:hypothetical protein [Holophagaceae bacterium]